MNKYKVVIDTNLLIAGNFNPQSASRRILEMATKDKIRHLWTQDIKKEHKFILSKVPKKQGYLSFVSEIYKPENEIKNPPVVKKSEDPDDDKYLACAKKGKADYIVSADDHLLSIKKFGQTDIVRPSEFIRRTNDKSRNTKYRVSSDFHGGKRKHPGRLV